VTDHAHLRLVVDRRAEDIARAVALIAGAREGYGPARVARMAEVAGAIATAAGLDEEAASRCVVAAWLHDIGMVALPDDALAPSDPAGYVDSPLVRAHVALGADLVTRVPELAPAADAVRHHHERYDGGGYPDGLAGDAIPLAARVVAAADALAEAAPQAAIGPRERKAAAHRLRTLAGTVLDPQLADAAVAVLATEADAAGEYLPRTA
jgi:response regulator RpfG family c-di-GMP phosphodiesterase